MSRERASRDVAKLNQARSGPLTALMRRSRMHRVTWQVTMVVRASDLPSSLARVGIDPDLAAALQRDLQARRTLSLMRT